MQIVDNSQKQTPTLVLFDHDGTICQTNENAYDSIKYCAREAAKVHKLDISVLEENWDSFFHETRGTTEKFGAQTIFYKITRNGVKFSDFEKVFYQARANWYHNMKTYNEYTYDTYYPDAENLIFKCWKNPNIHIGLVTGNPIDTMKERLATHLKELFFSNNDINAFGNEASSREELIKLSISKAFLNIPDFKLIKSENGFAQNIIYIGDSRADLFAALKARVKTIWIPSRMLQTVKDAIAEDSIEIIQELIPNTVHITNNLENHDIFEFITNP